ncbi:MAG: DUF4202 family protein [Pseudomonadota bacterium]
MSTIRFVSRRAPAIEPPGGGAALLLCAHGSAGRPGIAAAHGAAIAGRGLFQSVKSCALYGEPSLDQALAELSDQQVYLVPFLMAEGATYGALARRVDGAPDRCGITLCPPVGAHPAIVDLIEQIADQARRTRGWRREETALLLVGHGTKRHHRSAAAMRRHAEALAARGGFVEVATGFLSQDPSVASALAGIRAPRCVAVGYFADAGQHGVSDMPALLRAAGKRVCYTGPIGVSAKLRDIIVEQAISAPAPEISMTEPLSESERIRRAIAAFDDVNRLDPNKVPGDQGPSPKELVYGWRMTAWLEKLYPEASEALRLAARCQHIERWRIPRGDYPDGRAGYLKWRSDLKAFHAERGGAILRALGGFDSETVARVEALVRKERLKLDPEAQALEDVACLVFLEDHFAAFAEQHERAKIVSILRKTWRKMSPRGRAAALELDLPPEAGDLVAEALAKGESA